jgi:2-C-methyl-D-erythritol 4-phosphate cytidylyltransferase
MRKPFVPLEGRPLFLHAVATLQRCPVVRWIVVVVAEDARARVAQLLRRHRVTKALPPCAGGSSRAESVAKGFAALPKEARWVLIHDGARPCAGQPLMTRALALAKRWGAVACGLPASLTIKAVDEERRVRLTLDREHLWLAQTPQVFRRDWFAQALSQADHGLDGFPDDAAMVEAAGFSVRMILGDPFNVKVTTRADRLLATAILRMRARVTGMRAPRT